MGIIGRYKDVIAAICFFIFSVAIYINTSSIRVFAPNSANYINARFFPYIVSITLGLASLIQLIIAIRKVASTDAARKDDAKSAAKGGAIRIAATLALLAIYVFFLNTFGFLIMTAVYVFFQALLLTPKERINVRFALGLAVISSSVIYFLFTQVLTLMLPRAPFMPF